jgi:hypothetical protein
MRWIIHHPGFKKLIFREKGSASIAIPPVWYSALYAQEKCFSMEDATSKLNNQSSVISKQLRAEDEKLSE